MKSVGAAVVYRPLHARVPGNPEEEMSLLMDMSPT